MEDYNDRGILHRMHKVGTPSKNIVIKMAVKTALIAETTALFTKDVITNPFVGKEFHIKLVRRQGYSGKYRTHIKLIRAEAPLRPLFKPRGVFHRISESKRFVEGKHRNKSFIRRVAGSTLLTSEKAVIEAEWFVTRQYWQKLKNSSETMDTGKAIMTSVTTIQMLDSGRKYLINYRRNRAARIQKKTAYSAQKKQFATAKKKYKSAKKDYLQNKSILKGKLKKLQKSYPTNSSQQNSNDKKKIRLHNKKIRIVVKSKICYQKQLRNSERAIYRNKKKIKRLSKKEVKQSKIVPLAALPLVPSVTLAKNVLSSSGRKILNSDQNNDIVQGVNKSYKVGKSLFKAGKKISTKLYDKNMRIEFQKQKLHKQENKLNSNTSELKKNKRNHIKKKQKTAMQRAAEKAKIAAKKAAKETAKLVGDFTKFAIKLLGIFLAPIVGIIFIFSVILLMFTGAAGNNSYILGTYTAQDRYISWACEHYTKIAYDFNEKILKISTDWRNGLEELGVKTDSYKSDPDKLYWGKSDKFSQTPKFDYDDDKLASFMCAYYYEPPDDNGNTTYWDWKSDKEVDEILQNLFDTEYSFMQYYEDFSGWKQYQQYAVYGGGGASNGTYYTIEKEGFTKSQMKLKSVPPEIWAFAKDGYIHYDYDTLEVLDANNDDKKTGYFIQDQRYIIVDPKGNMTNSFYNKMMVERSEVEKYIYNGTVKYRTYDSTTYALLDNNGHETGYFIENIKSQPFKYYKFVWANGKNNDGSIKYSNRAQISFDGSEVYYIVSSSDTERWCGQKDTYLVSFYRKYYWYDNCSLYYTVNSKCTFDEAAESILKKRDNSAERINFYRLLNGNEDKDKAKPYGFHQLMDAPLNTLSLQKLIDNGKIYNRYGYNIKEWNKKDCEGLDGLHNGLDILAQNGDKVYAMTDGKIEWVKNNENSLSILSTVNYWYDNNADRTTAFKYVNIKTDLKEGDNIKAGQCIGTVTNKKHCYDDIDSKANKTYLHIEVAINYVDCWILNDTWSTVNPIYLMYRNDEEIVK